MLIVGLGESGAACAAFAHAAGARVTVADTRAAPPAAWLALCQALPDCHIVLGELSETRLDGVQELVMSPGLSPHEPATAAFLAAARARNIPVKSELDWFAQALEELSATQNYAPTVLAITGTNGKTTVTELTTHLCNEANISAVACGNIGPAALAALSTAFSDSLDNNDLPKVWVLELSSFQLHYTRLLRPNAATVLNISQDHLDWHADEAEYRNDKARIFAADTLRILNRDDPSYAVLSKKHAHLSFGLSAPTRVGDTGCADDGRLNWLALGVDAAPDRKRRKHEAAPCTAQHLMPADALRIRGGHNHANAQAALLLTMQAGVSLAQGLNALRSFEGAAHRCELVGVVGDVAYINDSKGTNVGATIAAIRGLCEARKRLILIAGGVGKGQDFTPLREAVAAGCKAVLLIGEAAPEIAHALAGLETVLIETAGDLSTALARAQSVASVGDTVLLSPACASFDQFKNYVQRGQLFTEAVAAIAHDAGVAL